MFEDGILKLIEGYKKEIEESKKTEIFMLCDIKAIEKGRVYQKTLEMVIADLEEIIEKSKSK